MARNRPLTVLIKPASSRCNLNCTYCFYLEKQSLYPWRTNPAMTLDTFRTFMDQYARVSSPYLTFAWQGGEPTMMGLRWFQEVVQAQIRAARAHAVLERGRTWELANALQTNGTLLDEEWARFFREYNFLIGLSLDGPPEWHDHYRVDRKGEGQHARVMRALELLRRFGAEFNVLCVVSAANVHRPRELLRYYTKLGIEHLQFIPCVEPQGGHHSGAVGSSDAIEFADYSITAEQYGDFLNGLFDAWMDVGFRKVRIRYFDSLLQMIVAGQPAVCHMAPACGYIVLEHNGDCYPCDFFVETEWKLGNVHETTIEAMLASDRFQQFTAMKPHLHPDCQVCPWRVLCHGECPRYRIIGTGAAEAQLSYFCASYKRFFGHTHKRLARTAETVRRDLDMPSLAYPLPAGGRHSSS
ncbi:MAG: anaerobic sulfatase maturase [Chloroflexi bacterium]|nr:anaerobic sulfatase maturase [Chloroflexota bacterium]